MFVPSLAFLDTNGQKDYCFLTGEHRTQRLALGRRHNTSSSSSSAGGGCCRLFRRGDLEATAGSAAASFVFPFAFPLPLAFPFALAGWLLLRPLCSSSIPGRLCARARIGDDDSARGGPSAQAAIAAGPDRLGLAGGQTRVVGGSGGGPGPPE